MRREEDDWRTLILWKVRQLFLDSLHDSRHKARIRAPPVQNTPLDGGRLFLIHVKLVYLMNR